MADNDPSKSTPLHRATARLLARLRAARRHLMAWRGGKAPETGAVHDDSRAADATPTDAGGHGAYRSYDETPEEPATAEHRLGPLKPPTGSAPEVAWQPTPAPPATTATVQATGAAGAEAGESGNSAPHAAEAVIPASTSLITTAAVPAPPMMTPTPSSTPVWTPSRRARNGFDLAIHLAQRPGFCCCCLCLGPIDMRRARRIFALVRAIKRAERGLPPPRRWLPRR